MNNQHVMKWHSETNTFRCRTGACSFEVTWDRMKDVGYRPFKDGVVFVDATDFEEGVTERRCDATEPFEEKKP